MHRDRVKHCNKIIRTLTSGKFSKDRLIFNSPRKKIPGRWCPVLKSVWPSVTLWNCRYSVKANHRQPWPQITKQLARSGTIFCINYVILIHLVQNKWRQFLTWQNLRMVGPVSDRIWIQHGPFQQTPTLALWPSCISLAMRISEINDSCNLSRQQLSNKFWLCPIIDQPFAILHPSDNVNQLIVSNSGPLSLSSIAFFSTFHQTTYTIFAKLKLICCIVVFVKQEEFLRRNSLLIKRNVVDS